MLSLDSIASMVQPGIRLVAPCSLPRKMVLSAVSLRWAPILTRTREPALVCAHSTAASAVAAMKAYTLTTGAMCGSSRTSAERRYKIVEEIHTIGASWPVSWVTIHDTEVDGAASFDANTLAKAAGATPFKRPENGQFQPSSHFRTFVFTITGDTSAVAGGDPVLAARGAWGGLFRVDLNADRETGNISLVILGDADHAAFDNVTFVDDRDTVLLAEDRGDLLHDQLNTLDSVWAYKLNREHPERNAVARFVALAQDRLAGVAGEEDNEPTGIHMSEGDSTIGGLIGTREFRTDAARLFFTQQHGENNLFEVSPLD